MLQLFPTVSFLALLQLWKSSEGYLYFQVKSLLKKKKQRWILCYIRYVCMFFIQGQLGAPVSTLVTGIGDLVCLLVGSHVHSSVIVTSASFLKSLESRNKRPHGRVTLWSEGRSPC